MTTQLESYILIEILEDDSDLYQEWDAALEKTLGKCRHY